MKNFEGFGLSNALNQSLAKMQYTTPTPIQAQAIPLALQGRDVLGSAQTGTGKTAAFSIPMVEMVLNSQDHNALILTPTRELAKQVLDVVHQLLGYKSQINTAFIIGGESMGKQMGQLRAKPRIIVGTPGRVNDHLRRGTLKLDQTTFLVLDETDRMLDMGFGVQLDEIVKFLPRERQTLMFSATMPDGIVKISNKYLTNPERISMGATNVVAQNITQDFMRVEQDHKYKELLVQLHERMGSVIIFAKTKRNAERMAKNLNRDGFDADALHGDLRQGKRTSVMNKFRNKKFRILVATDIAARGLDVPHIEHVINYDLPQVAEDYIHRMGRTARAGAEGSALSFVSPQDSRKWHAIECLLDPTKKAMSSSAGPKRSGKPRRGNGGGKPYAGGPRRPQQDANGQKRDGKPNKYAKSGKPDNNGNHEQKRENTDGAGANKYVKSRKPGGFKGKPGAKAGGKPGANSGGFKGKPRHQGGNKGPYKNAGKPNHRKAA